MNFFHLYKKELLSFVFCFFLCLFVSFFLHHCIMERYQQSFLENNAFLINGILEKHPELESEIMAIFKNPDRDYSIELLKKYGFTDLESLSYIDFVADIDHFTMISIWISLFFCFGFVFLIVISFYFQKHRRIKDINDYLFRVLHNDYQMDLKDYREDSISALKNDLIKVTNKLRNVSEISVTDKKNLERTLSDISHQLRTPLTSLSVINDVLSSGRISKQEENAFLQQQKEQLTRMEWLIVTLLKMSQIDSGTITFQKNIESVEQMISEALKPSLIPLELKQIHYEINIDSKMTYPFDFRWTVEAFVNIIKNAMEHTESNGEISITAIDNPMYLEIIVKDNGSGIPKEQLPHIFERFYKGNSKSDSIGIGLNLSQTIIEKQNGTIHVESEIGKGTKFIIHFFKVTI